MRSTPDRLKTPRGDGGLECPTRFFVFFALAPWALIACTRRCPTSRYPPPLALAFSSAALVCVCVEHWGGMFLGAWPTTHR